MSDANDPAATRSQRHHGGPTRDLVNDVAELIRQSRDPVATARAVIGRVDASRERQQADGAMYLVQMERGA